MLISGRRRSLPGTHTSSPAQAASIRASWTGDTSQDYATPIRSLLADRKDSWSSGQVGAQLDIGDHTRSRQPNEGSRQGTAGSGKRLTPIQGEQGQCRQGCEPNSCRSEAGELCYRMHSLAFKRRRRTFLGSLRRQLV